MFKTIHRMLLAFVLAVPAAAPAQFIPSANDTIDPRSTGGRSYQIHLTSAHDGSPIVLSVHEPTVIAAGQTYPLVLQGHGAGMFRSQTPQRPGPSSGVTEPELPHGGLPGNVTHFTENGFYVVSFDQKGHGESGGTIRVMDPDHEGLDLIQMLDWVEANVQHLAYRDGNLLLGSVGGSYGGGFQMLLLAIDPERRLDAIVPSIAWHDLRESLQPQGVVRSSYALGLSLLVARAADPYVQQQAADAGAKNRFSQDFLDFLYYHSPRYWCDGVGLPGNQQSGVPYRQARPQPPVDAIFIQGMHDILFTLNEALDSYECLKGHGGDVRLYTYQSGHIGPESLGMFSPPPIAPATCNGPNCLTVFNEYFNQYFEQYSGGTGTDADSATVYSLGCGPYHSGLLELYWMQAKLKRDPIAAARLAEMPEICLALDSTGDAVGLDSLTIAPVEVEIPATTLVLNALQAEPIGLPLVTLDATRVLAGKATATLTIAPVTPDPGVSVPQAGVDDPVIFVGFARSRASYLDQCRRYAAMDPSGFSPRVFCDPVESAVGDLTVPSQLEVIDDQVLPIRGFGTHEVEMVGVGERLGAGEQLQLVIYGFHGGFAISGSRNATTLPLTIGGTVRIPLAANLPKLELVELEDGDEDFDGVRDETDQCPATLAGESVDAAGCADSQKDSDEDGFTDDVDNCPDEPGPNQGCPANANADADGDGVIDSADRCPGTAAGAVVDARGCPAASGELSVSLAADPVQADVTNGPQTVSFTARPTVGDAELSGALSYVYYYGDGTHSDATAQTQVSHAYARAGRYTSTVVVVDENGNSATGGVELTMTTTVTVSDPQPQSVVAVLSIRTDGGTAPVTATLDASASQNPPPGAIYAFDFGDGSTRSSTNPVVVHVYPLPDEYAVSVTVSDPNDAQNTSSAAGTITVHAAQQTTAILSVSPSSAIVNETEVRFDASGSVAAPGETIASYRFDFYGDGSEVLNTASPTATFVYTRAGSFEPKVTVNDSAGASAQAKAAVRVQPGSGANPQPRARRGSGGGALGWITVLPLLLIGIARRRGGRNRGA